MKVVCCKNCGAKYKLGDSEDINTYECTSCAGNLELLEDYPSDEFDYDSEDNDTYSEEDYDTFITQCVDCGLKYRIKSNENILDYECESCGGSLRYLDEKLNDEVDAFIKDHGEEHLKKAQEEDSAPKEKLNEKTVNSIKSIPTRLENFFSDEQLNQLEEEYLEREEAVKNEIPTAKTQIPESVLKKYEKIFSLPESNDYFVMKEYLKSNFYKSILEDYEINEEDTPKDGVFGKMLSKLTIQEPQIRADENNNIEEKPKERKELETSHKIIILGAVIFIASALDIFLIHIGFGLVTLLFGVIILCYGIYKTKDEEAVQVRSKIIRKRLLTLPEDYYVFYNVKIPKSNVGINHVVIGPSGIYSIVTQKYNPSRTLDSENENNRMIGDEYDNEGRLKQNQNHPLEFRYTTRQDKFLKDNKIKQKSLRLGENLINFLNKNYIPNCFVEPLVGFVNEDVAVINMPLNDEDLFLEELLYKIQNGPRKLDNETINKCAVLLNKYSADCSEEEN